MGTYATKAQVLAYAPELAAVDGAVLAELVEDAQDMLDADLWGDKLFRGHRSLAAHLATVVLNPSGGGGVVTSRRIDKIGETYATGGTMSDAELADTKYGRIHIMLRNTLTSTISRSSTRRGHTLPDGRIM